jgi:regulator of protease activity HflC (stomatin/prohibitin superfamily)
MRSTTDEEQESNPLFIPTILILAILSALLILTTAVFINPGEVGVFYNALSGGIQPDYLGQGFHLILPLVQGISKMSIRTQNIQYDASAASKDLQLVSAQIAINFQIQPNDAVWVYQNLGPDYQNTVIHPKIQEIFKATTSQFNAEELIQNRQMVSNAAYSNLNGALAKYHIQLQEVNIVNFNFSDDFNNAIEQKVVAGQKLMKAEIDLKTAEVAANQTVVNASAQAEAFRLLNETTTPLVLQQLAISKWDGKLPMVVGGAYPFVPISNYENQAVRNPAVSQIMVNSS